MPHKVHIDQTRVMKLFFKMYNKAEAVIKDPNRFKSLLKEAGDLVEGTARGPLKEVADQFRLFIAMLKDYRSGEYTKLPQRTLLSVAAALLYLISPVDVIPDFIPLVGVIDDIFVANLVWKQVRKDLDAYLLWKEGVSKGLKRVVLPDELKPKTNIVDTEFKE